MSLFGDDDLPDDFMDLVEEIEADEPIEQIALGLDKVDLAAVKPCPGCGDPVRQFSAVPTGGSGISLTFPGPWYCSTCIQAKCSAAYAAVRSVDTTAPLD